MKKGNRKATIKSHVTHQERAVLLERSRRMNMSMSDYMRRILINFKLPKAVIDAQVVRDLLRINADLARLGNLLKLTLDEGKGDQEKINGLITNAHQTQAQLKKKILEIKL